MGVSESSPASPSTDPTHARSGTAPATDQSSRARSASGTPDVETEFDREWQRETTRLLRRRWGGVCFSWLVVLSWPLFASMMIIVRGEQAAESSVAAATVARLGTLLRQPVVFTGMIGRLVALGIAYWLGRYRLRSRDALLELAFWLLIVLAGFEFTIIVGFDPLPDLPPWSEGILGSLRYLALGHLATCLLLPWPVRTAAAPLLLIYPAWALLVRFDEQVPVVEILGQLLDAALISGGGLLICAWRSARLQDRFELEVLRRRFRSTRQELVDARKIHEALFPEAGRYGDYRLDFDYEPMRQIGGDFVAAHLDEAGRLHFALFDVTGHGLAAALTVNRIEGEWQRLHAVGPDATPAETAIAINRYLNLTLLRHGMFATGVVARLDPDGTLHWVNCGHPPGFLCYDDARPPRPLESTTFLLGACPDDEFDPEPVTLTMPENATLLIYTDGLCEARDARGRQFGRRGLDRALERWTSLAGTDRRHLRRPLVHLLPDIVRHWRDGDPEDDVLVTTITRLRPRPDRRPRSDGPD